MWILEIADLSDSFEVFSPDMVVHLAARTDLRGSALEDYDSNTLGVEFVSSYKEDALC